MFPYGLRCSLDGTTGYRLVASAKVKDDDGLQTTLCLEGPEGSVWVPIKDAGRIALEDS